MQETISPVTEKLLSYAHAKGIGARRLNKLAGFPDFASAKRLDLGQAHPEILTFLPTQDEWLTANQEAGKDILQAEKFNARILSVLDPDYPPLLASSPDRPAILYVRGNVSALSAKSLAVIGTRTPTAHGKLTAERITSHFAEDGWTIVSGLALGCDAAAHEAALRVGTPTVAVMAHGLQTITPTQNKALAERILASGGALVSEFAFGQEPLPGLYAARDKTQAGLSQGVILIQSDIEGGSLHASRAALRYNRWLAVAYPTERDRTHNEPKIAANLLIADGSAADKSELLQCRHPYQLDYIHVLRSRNDYNLIVNRPINVSPFHHSQENPSLW